MALKAVFLKVAVDGFTSTLISVCIALFSSELMCFPGEPSIAMSFVSLQVILFPVLAFTTCCFRVLTVTCSLVIDNIPTGIGNNANYHVLTPLARVAPEAL